MAGTHLASTLEPRPDPGRTVDPAQPNPDFAAVPASSLSATKRVHKHRHRLDGNGIKPPFPCGHHAGTAIGDGLDDGRLVGAVEPDPVGQVRRAKLLVALAIVAMTGDAVVSEDLGSRGCVVSWPRRQAR